jgi:prepilin-type N-terminal cleavage/methylation domain-containing protein
LVLRPSHHRTIAPSHGFTLIELLIAIAIVAILTGSLAFSSTQILGRSHLMGRVLQLDASFEAALDALAGDVARSVGRERLGSTGLRLTQFDGRVVEYRLEENRLIRRDSPEHMAVLASEGVSGEFIMGDDGVEARLRAALTYGPREIEREAALFVPWPERVGVRP